MAAEAGRAEASAEEVAEAVKEVVLAAIWYAALVRTVEVGLVAWAIGEGLREALGLKEEGGPTLEEVLREFIRESFGSAQKEE